MKVAVVIVNFRTPELAISCLHSVAAERERVPGLKAILVDNCSGDHSQELFRATLREPVFADWTELLQLPINGGFGWANNQAILKLLQSADPPDFIHLLNPDASLNPGAIAALLEEMGEHNNAGAIGSQLLNPDGTASGSAFRFPSIGREWVRGHGLGRLGRIFGIKDTLVDQPSTSPVGWVTGASVLFRSEALRQAGLFDTGFFLYFEEVELMHRLGKAGWKIYHCPRSRVVHLEGASTKIENGRDRGSRSVPDYIFQSRRRYFSLTRGRVLSFLAGLAWLLGSYLRVIAEQVRPTGRKAEVDQERRGLLRNGLIPSVRDRSPAITAWTDPQGHLPAWMA